MQFAILSFIALRIVYRIIN